MTAVERMGGGSAEAVSFDQVLEDIIKCRHVVTEALAKALLIVVEYTNENLSTIEESAPGACDEGSRGVTYSWSERSTSAFIVNGALEHSSKHGTDRDDDLDVADVYDGSPPSMERRWLAEAISTPCKG